MGPDTILTKEEEQRLVDWLKNLSTCGFPQNSEGLLDAAQRIIHEAKRKTPFKDERPGKKWYYSFLKRHPQLSLRTPEGITKGRAVVTEQTIRKWFSDLHSFLRTENYEDVLEDPTRIFNLDETSFSLAPKTGCVLAPRGARNVYQVKCGNEKETLTVLLTFSANGEMLPPMIVYPYLRPPKALVENMPHNWALGRSEKGWMKAETFYAYIENNFNSWLQNHNVKRPIIVFLDGHKSHMSIQLNEFCSKNQIILYCLPNTTHILQPADVGAFKGIKSDYKLSVQEWQSKPENSNKSVTKLNFCDLLENVLNKSDRTETIKNSFRKCGLFPLNPENVDYSRCIQTVLEHPNETRIHSSAPKF